MKKNKFREIRSEIRKRFDQACNLLLLGKDTEAERELKWIGLARQILEERNKRLRPIIAAGILFTSFVVTLAALTEKRDTMIEVDIHVNEVTLRPNSLMTLNELSAKEVIIDNLEIPSFFRCPGQRRLRIECSEIRLIADWITIYDLKISKSTIVHFEAAEDMLNISIIRSPIKGEIKTYYAKIDSTQCSIQGQSNLGGPNCSLDFKAGGVDSILGETRIVLKKQVAWEVEDTNLESIEFRKYHPVTGWISTIISGRVFLSEIEKEVKLKRDELLEIKMSKVKSSISKTNNEIRVELTGRVSSIKRDDLSLMPTWVEYFYYNDRPKLLWGVLCFLWGLFWSAKNLIANSR